MASAPVKPDGSFTATVPADRPIFWLLRTATGVVDRTAVVPPGTTQTSFVPTHDYFRPGTTVQCIGCHRGHMINSGLTFAEGRTNLARLAVASASSAQGSFFYAPLRVNDGLISDELGRYDWASRREKYPWVRLDWVSPLTVSEVVIYPRTKDGNRLQQASLNFSDGSSIPVQGFREDGSPLKLSFTPRLISWLQLKVLKGEGPSLGVAEMLVHGDSPVIMPAPPPSPPQGLKSTQGTILLTWNRNVEPYLGGYRIFYGTSPGHYTTSLYVGNVNTFLVTGLEDGKTYYFALKSYNLTGKESYGFSNEVTATFYAPRLASVSSGGGSIWGGTEVTLKGQHFAPRGLTVLFGGKHARVVSSGPDWVTAATSYHPAGVVDVTLINPDGARTELPSSFTYFGP